MTTQVLKREFVILKNKQLKPLDVKEALEVALKLSKIKRELIERGVEPKELV
jgi:hypothetical protein